MVFIYYKDFKTQKIIVFGALAGQIQHMAAQKVGFTPRPITYGPPNFPVSSLAALESLKSGPHIRAELESCQIGQLGEPYPRSMQKSYPFWALVSPLWIYTVCLDAIMHKWIS